jgi:hypothetical protein
VTKMFGVLGIASPCLDSAGPALRHLIEIGDKKCDYCGGFVYSYLL